MPYIGNVLTSFAVETGNINDQAVTAPKLSATGGTDGQVLALDSNLNLEWVSDPAGQWVTSGSNIYYNDGNVGIGTSSPESNLHIADTSGPIIRLTNSTGTDGTYTGRISTGDAAGTFFAGINFFKHDTNDGEIRFRTKVANTNQDTVTIVDGRVGIGTSSPAQPLDIVTSGADAYIRQSNGTVTGFVGVNNNNSTFDIYTFSNHPTRFFTNNTERMRIDSSGNVIIGTGSLASNVRLRIKAENSYKSVLQFADQDDDNVGEIAYNHNDNTLAVNVNDSERMRIDSSGNVGIGGTPGNEQLLVRQSAVTNAPTRSAALYLENNANCEIQFVGNSSNDCQLRFGTSSNSFKGALEYQLDNNALLTYTNGSERMRIDSSGRVLVGITSASSAVGMIVGKSVGDSIGRIFVGKNDSTIANGNGIGSIQFGGSADETQGAEIKGEADATWTHSSSHPSRLVFSTTASSESSPTERLRIDSSGQVGIGTTSPGSKLQIKDTMQATANQHNQLSIIGDDNGTNGESARIFLSAINATNRGCGIVAERQSSSNNHDLIFQTSPGGGIPAERVRILAEGGLTFGGDTAAANALDDYEEGDWTPDLQFGGAKVGITYANQYGKYVKIGRLVHVFGRVTLSSKGSSGGIARFFGLPYVTESITGTTMNIGSIWYSGFNLQGSIVQVVMRTDGNGNSFVEPKGVTTNAEDAIGDSDFTNSTDMCFSVTYRTT